MGGLFGPSSKNGYRRGANDALIVRFQIFRIFLILEEKRPIGRFLLALAEGLGFVVNLDLCI